MEKFILTEELWPKEHNETTVEYFETNEVMKAHVKDWLAAEHPTEFQIKDIPADLTWGKLIDKIKNPNKEGPAWDFQLDTEPREFLWQRACELYYLQTGEFLDSDFERIYKEKRTDLQTPEEKVKGEEMLKDKIRIADDPVAEEPTPIEDDINEGLEEGYRKQDLDNILELIKPERREEFAKILLAAREEWLKRSPEDRSDWSDDAALNAFMDKYSELFEGRDNFVIDVKADGWESFDDHDLQPMIIDFAMPVEEVSDDINPFELD